MNPRLVALGSSVAVRVALSYVTTAGASAPVESRSSKVVVLIVVSSIGSLKIAVTLLLALTPVAPLVGDVVVTTGGVVSGPIDVAKSTSTQ